MASGADTFRILLVEDQPAIRELVATMLRSGSTDVDAAATGAEGLTRVRETAYDLILLDIVLPVLDGLSLCRLIKADPTLQKTPLYMLTANSKRSDVEAATAAGANGYIHKPFRTSELVELVERLRSEKRAALPSPPG